MDLERSTAKKRRRSPQENEFAVNKKSCNVRPSSKISFDGDGLFKRILRSQDLAQLRKELEKGNLDLVKWKIWANPRFLISKGDMPSILQEGARYNALHVAARSSNADMAALIIDTIADPKFIRLKFGDFLIETNCRQRSSILLDLYINMPDKSLHETPLHIACKLGAARVVEVFVNVPECNRHQLNKDGLAPADIICSRQTPNETAAEEIKHLLQDTFFVPVLRSPTLEQPEVGLPFSAATPLVSTCEVSAFAGPMQLEQAKSFQKQWKAPSLRRNLSFRTARLSDFHKGLERQGRDLARQQNVKWQEFWHFLGIYTDLGSLEGLTTLEEFFKAKFSEQLASSGDAASATSETLSSVSLSLEQITPSKSMRQPSPQPALKKTPNMPQQRPQTPICKDQKQQVIEWLDSEDSSDDESGDKFFTPPSSLPASGDEDVFEPADEGRIIFIDGTKPSKVDVDVLRACESSLLSAEKFPNIWRWRHQIQNYSEQERQSWKSPQVMGLMSSITSATVTSSLIPVIKRKVLPQSWISKAPPFISRTQ